MEITYLKPTAKFPTHQIKNDEVTQMLLTVTVSQKKNHVIITEVKYVIQKDYVYALTKITTSFGKFISQIFSNMCFYDKQKNRRRHHGPTKTYFSYGINLALRPLISKF